MQQQLKDMPDPLKFVEQKNNAVILKEAVKNWERKIEIAEVAGKKAKIIIRNAGGYVEEIVKPAILMSKTGSHHGIIEEENNDMN